MAKPEQVTISIDVKLPGKAEFRHLSITVDMVAVEGKAAIDIEQFGDSPEADKFSVSWLKDALMLFERRQAADKVPDKLN